MEPPPNRSRQAQKKSPKNKPDASQKVTPSQVKKKELIVNPL